MAIIGIETSDMSLVLPEKKKNNSIYKYKYTIITQRHRIEL